MSDRICTTNAIATILQRRQHLGVAQARQSASTVTSVVLKRGPVLWIVLATWLFYFVSLTAARVLQGSSDDIQVIAARLMVSIGGATITLLISFVIARAPLTKTMTRITMAFIIASAGCAAHTLVNYVVFYRVMQISSSEFLLADQAMAIANWIWVYLGITALLIAQRHGTDLADRDLRLAQTEALSRSAELRALRYQLNPHFLFNALNSVAALIGQARGSAAQLMIENLADFLRASLSLDLMEDITLAREVDLQRLYLSVEIQRFPDRLDVTLDIPEELEEARLPSLILQPLVENTVKHAVSQSRSLVRLSVSARMEDGLVRISVSDDGGDANGSAVGGSSVGLENVRARLRARFGDIASFEARPLSGLGFENVIKMPLVVRDDAIA